MIEQSVFGTAKDGTEVKSYVLTNRSGMKVKLLDLGATIAEIWTLDRFGQFGDVVLGYGTPAEYEQNSGYIGAVVGRVANRIGGAEFMLGGKRYQLDANNGVNSLHGGFASYSTRVWDAAVDEMRNRVTFKLFSPDGDQGYPGNLWIKVTYTLTDEGELKIRYQANTDQMTIINLTNHAYFNLSGKLGAADVLDHKVWMNSDQMTPVVDAGSIPTGEFRDVAGTPMDFTVPKTLGRDIEADYDQINYGGGYDHNWMLKRGDAQIIVYHPETGRRMTVITDQPGVQMYTGNFLRGLVPVMVDGKMVEVPGKDLMGQEIKYRSGVCFETQVPPDAVHHDNFPNCILMPEMEYESETTYRFDVAEDGYWE